MLTFMLLYDSDFREFAHKQNKPHMSVNNKLLSLNIEGKYAYTKLSMWLFLSGCCRHLLTVGLENLEGVVYLDDQDRKMIVTRGGGMRPQLVADCHVPPDLRFTFYDQVHTTGTRYFFRFLACFLVVFVSPKCSLSVSRVRGVGAGAADVGLHWQQ